MSKNENRVESEKSCDTCFWDNVARNEHCLACLEKDEFIGWQQKYNQTLDHDDKKPPQVS